MEKEDDDTRLLRKEKKSVKNSWRVYFDSVLPSGLTFLIVYTMFHRFRNIYNTN